MAIFFDLDGTLVDTLNDIILAINNLCKELNRPLADFNVLKSNVSFGLEKILSRALNIDPSKLGLDELNNLKLRFRKLYKESRFESSRVFPGLDLLINKIKENNIKVAVVTNKNMECAEPILKRVGLFDKLDCLVTSDMVPKPKPAPDSVLFAIEKLNVRPSDCLFIGDAEQDIIAGNEAGVKTVAALFGYIGDEKLALKWPANYFVKTPNELLPLLSNLYALA